jgi:copper homeostasis protein
MILEFCSEGANGVKQAISAGVNRIELCLDLAIGGITPPILIVDNVAKLCNSNNIELATMVRPKSYGFVNDLDYSTKFIEDFVAMSKTNSTSLVIGALTNEYLIDWDLIKLLVTLNNNSKELVFHMAFDHHIEKHPELLEQTINKLVDLGFKRILTHGSPNNERSVFDNLELLIKTHKIANGRIEIMVGGGVTNDVAKELDKIHQFDAYHGTKIVYT